jgi:23S rRNA (guanine745-N1)-methyltransferase
MTEKPLPLGLLAALKERVLACPICLTALVQRGRSLACAQNHVFDVARQGHITLLRGSLKKQESDTSYAAEFVQARRFAIERGFFDALVAELTKQIANSFPKGSLSILDAGSGEGSLFEILTPALSHEGFAPRCCVGIDLAPAGVRYAAGRSKECAWCVADLAQIPCCNGSIDVVLNVLSPANYTEFTRVLRPKGLLLKVVPTANHLLQIRNLLQGSEEFSNEKVATHFAASVKMLSAVRVESQIPCGKEAASQLFHMTPLSWHASANQKRKFMENAPPFLTVSFDVLVGEG